MVKLSVCLLTRCPCGIFSAIWWLSCRWRWWSPLVVTIHSLPQPPNLRISAFPLGNYPHCCIQLWLLCPWVVALVQYKTCQSTLTDDDRRHRAKQHWPL